MDPERDQIRQQVDEARMRVSDDVQDVAQNLNVVEKAKQAVRDKIEGVKDAAGDMASTASDAVGGAVSSARENAGRLGSNMSNFGDNPLAMLLGGLALGFLAGLVLPVSRFEADRVRPLADDLKDRARQAGQEAVRRGNEVIKDTIEAGRDAAVQAIKEQTADVSGSAAGGSSGGAGNGLRQADQTLGPGQ